MKRILAVLLCVVVLVSLLAVTALATDFGVSDLWSKISGATSNAKMEVADGASMTVDAADAAALNALLEGMSDSDELPSLTQD